VTPVLENLPPSTLPRLLRRTSVSAVLTGAVAFFGALFLHQISGAIGVLIGIGLAIFNLRLVDRRVAKVEIRGDQPRKAVRRQLASGTLGRLAILTIVVLGAVAFDAPLGIGIVAGLALYQIVFVLNVLRVVGGQGGIE
jgi:ATP synthase I chain